MSGFAARRRIATVSVVVADYDQAIAWYVGKLGLSLVEDVDLGGGKRWITVEPGSGQGTRLLLAKADGESQVAAIGNQTGGRVFLFLETDDFARDHAAMLANGVEFREAPRHEAYGTVAVFADLCGNLWDLIEPKR
ncbi:MULTISPECIES: VOC family protein [Aminobacter]|uniref:Catechol 2,3-dioxygenase-like lactoylglutathione lyase family enzyme n=2 Tax=Aminobacter TaxID=31988 RepID=A0AAC8YLB9_AMIAI|nr:MULTISPECIES: VOC family protein [Aminobacter]AMS40492.1 extradiol dioxygenase [Aminobacter aminovorans]MBA8905714.1 catechol 2,3-dioxygenase-like lactoylglutathione lyase family enzyme [Aminobacter ciceronei]MBA9019493.1 catechol 2,3-dioxygenase-like lactoylglutathione lyase family enzyme [Aminobacter ciceronei]MBB3706576.1 catechol 2,3-dioxygenase-like lactoylglutathione lyase family enzyme [Aminobacter aminovorans]WMC96329.1 VOC family protein [Aminobacter aminovorans]